MTIPRFPSLPGMGFTTRTPVWKTDSEEPVSGKIVRYPRWTFPLYRYQLDVNLLRLNYQTEYWDLMAFYGVVSGGGQPFHYHDPDDFTVTGQSIGVGDASTVVFPFQRTMPSANYTFSEPCTDVDTTQPVKIYVDGVQKTLTTDYTLLVTPVYGTTYAVQFNAAPAAGALITADFQFFWLSAFQSDSYDFAKFDSVNAEVKGLSWETIKQ